MKVMCGRCVREDLKVLLVEDRSLSDEVPAHAVCERHGLSLHNALASQSFSGIRLLVVVDGRERILFDYLRDTLTGLRDVAIIMERRQQERRGHLGAVREDRRQHDRRQRAGDAAAPWYRYVRFGQGWSEERCREPVP